MDSDKFPAATSYSLDFISSEIKRMILERERPFHHDLVCISDLIPDLERLGISFTPITLGHCLKYIGAFRSPRMTVNSSLTCLWAVRDIDNYRRMGSTWLKKYYLEHRAAKLPKMGPRFDPDAPR